MKTSALIAALTSKAAIIIGSIIVVAAIAITAVVVTSNSSTSDADSTQSSSESTSSNDSNNSAENGARDKDAMRAEYDAFVTAQGGNEDDVIYTAFNEEQQQFVDHWKPKLAELGIGFDEDVEFNMINLGLGACERSIIDYHEIDAEGMQEYATYSESSVGGSLDLDMQIAVSGTKFVCPDDHSQWQAAYDEIDGNWRGKE